MPWPRGVPRKGHVNKNGKPHARLGRLTKAEKQAKSIHLSIPMMEETLVYKPKPKRVPTVKPVEKQPAKTRKYSTKLAHPQYSIEPCPNCLFPEADGGHCPDCGWTRPVEKLPANSVHGRTFKR
jgi:hypothetical protein